MCLCLCRKERGTESTLSNHVYPENLPRTGLMPSPNSWKHKNNMTSAFQIFYLQMTQQQTTPPPASFTRTNKKHWAIFYLNASMWGSLSTGSKLKQEQRGNMLLSPVCVPSVCKLHQQHKLDHEENEAADCSHIAPHCGIGGRNKVKQSRFSKCGIVLHIIVVKKWPVVTFQKCFLFWEEEASSTACYQCNKLQQPEPDNQTSNIIKGNT